jgi:hypothetical protein
MQSKSERRIRDSSIVMELLRIGVIVLGKHAMPQGLQRLKEVKERPAG